MKKQLLLLFTAVMLLQGTATKAQTGDPEHRFSVGLTPNFNTGKERVGLSGNVKWLLPTAHKNNYRFLLTAKATHTPGAEGGFFRVFDKGKYDNVTALHLLGGYRINFFNEAELLNPTVYRPNVDAFYVELNAGASYVHAYGKAGVAVSPVLGYSFKQKVDLTAGYHATWIKNSQNLSLLEIGVAYNF